MESLIEKVGEIYNRIAEELKANRRLAGDCRSCGKCCNFAEFDHRLYVTPVEIDYLAFHIGAENIKPMQNGICPYNIEGKCSVYEWRFAGCRVFSCRGDKDFQSLVTESVLKELKGLCIKFNIPYRYLELPEALKG